MQPLDLDTLLFAAIRRTGSKYSGDPQCEDSLKVLIDACNNEAALSLVGQFAVKQYLLELLETRFRLLDYWQKAHEIQEQTVLPQIFITGLPKSGSTFLHRLLAHDSNNRVPRMWEVMYPLPAPRSATYDSDLRIGKTDSRLRWLRWSHRELVKAHPVGALIPQECGAILGYCFQSNVFLDMFTIPSYETWLRSRNLDWAYQFHAEFLKHLQWQCPAERWILKSSDHLHALETLVRIYPEARFVFLHRHPLKVLQAACNQMALLKGVFSLDINLHQLGSYEAHCLHDKIDKIIKFREDHAHFESRCIDVGYRNLASNPVGTVRAIYSHFGLPLGHEAESRMQAFADSEANKSRSDRFSLAHFNLNPKQQSTGFDLYCKRFSVEREEL